MSAICTVKVRKLASQVQNLAQLVSFSLALYTQPWLLGQFKLNSLVLNSSLIHVNVQHMACYDGIGYLYYLSFQNQLPEVIDKYMTELFNLYFLYQKVIALRNIAIYTRETRRTLYGMANKYCVTTLVMCDFFFLIQVYVPVVLRFQMKIFWTQFLIALF